MSQSLKTTGAFLKVIFMIIYIRKNKSNVRLVIFTFVLHNGNRFFYFIQYRIAVLENSGGCLVDISPVFQKLHKNITQIAVVGLILLAEYFVTGGSSHFYHTGLLQFLQQILGIII